jgi:opacity protein-like surface antigen
MRKITLLTTALIFGWLSIAQAQVWVDPYTRKDGTQVQEHYRSNPDGNRYNNYSYPGNTNPYTGKQATGDPNRYLEQLQKNNSGSNGQNHYQFNPYQRRW